MPAPSSWVGATTPRERSISPRGFGEEHHHFAPSLNRAAERMPPASFRWSERQGDHYRLKGSKTFISMAPDADVYCVFAKTDPTKGSKGITGFIVEKGFPGFVPGERLDLVAPHPIGSLYFEDCLVPAANRLGEEGEGFKIAMRTLDFFRTTVGACAVGLAQAALTKPSAMPKSGWPSASRSRNFNWFKQSWRIWPQKSARPGYWSTSPLS